MVEDVDEVDWSPVVLAIVVEDVEVVDWSLVVVLELVEDVAIVVPPSTVTIN